MRIVLADIKGGDGFISKDTVVGGYGSRLKPFSKVTRAVVRVKKCHELPSVHLAYAAALAARAGHEVVVSSGELVDGDIAIVLSSLVDYRRETAWAQAMRTRGVRVGFIGLTSQKLPHLFEESADFIVDGEPEGALLRLVGGEALSGMAASPQIDDLDSLPFPLWDGLVPPRRRIRVPFAARSYGGALPVLASRSCPEPCTYCPHRIQGTYRSRSVANILDELSYLEDTRGPLHIVFRGDPVARAVAHLRVRDTPRPTRWRSAGRAAPGGPAHHELRRRIGGADNAQEGGTATDTRAAPAGDGPALPRTRDRHRGVLRVRVCRRHVGIDPRDDRVLD
jgi:hypothetical protein